MERTDIQELKSNINIKRAKNYTYGIFLAVILMLIIIFSLTRFLCKSVEVKNNKLKDQVKNLSSDIDTAKMLTDQQKIIDDRIKSVEAISKDKVIWSEIMLYVDKLMPKGIAIKSFSGNESQVTMQCMSENVEALTLFIKSLENSKQLKNVRLIDMSPAEGQNNIKFGVYFMH